jgi:hypothetical protein
VFHTIPERTAVFVYAGHIGPRLFWPDKPSVNDSNRWYQVACRLTIPNDLNGVSIAVGYLPESYINFRGFGPPLAMFCLGILLGLFDKIFLRPGSGLLLNSVGVALLPQLLPVEAQLAQYIAGFGEASRGVVDYVGSHV